MDAPNAEQHFDAIASRYDYWKNHNRYYYDNLFKLYASYIPAGSSVVEIGCGTGDIIVKLEPRDGRGIDVSEEMIQIARKKHAHFASIKFDREDIDFSLEPFRAEYIFLADVLEHLNESFPQFMQTLSKRVQPPTNVIISVANPRWEWLLMLAERLKMKMPEGPHIRLPVEQNEEIFRRAGFKIVERGYRLLVPKRLPGSDWINTRFYNNKLLKKFGFVVFWVLTK